MLSYPLLFQGEPVFQIRNSEECNLHSQIFYILALWLSREKIKENVIDISILNNGW